MNKTPGFDVLQDVFSTLRFRGSVFFSSQLAAPWGLALGHDGFPRFHIALSGDCVVGSGETGDLVHVKEMDIVVLPGGDPHWIAHAPGRDLLQSELAAEACELDNPYFQQGELTNHLLCGRVRFDQELTHPILASLPSVLHFSVREHDDPVWMTVSLLNAQLKQTHARHGPIVDRLCEVLFLQLLDHHLSMFDDSHGFLAALRDRRITQALSLIHQDPGRQWTLASLAEAAGMSRATLVHRFQDRVGIAPMSYIANWRLSKAYNMIKWSGAPLEQVADTVGFACAKTLSKALLRQFKVTPSGLRRGEE